MKKIENVVPVNQDMELLSEMEELEIVGGTADPGDINIYNANCVANCGGGSGGGSGSGNSGSGNSGSGNSGSGNSGSGNSGSGNSNSGGTSTSGNMGGVNTTATDNTTHILCF